VGAIYVSDKETAIINAERLCKTFAQRKIVSRIAWFLRP